MKTPSPQDPFPASSPIAEWQQSEETKAARRRYLSAVLSAGRKQQLEQVKSQAAEQNKKLEETSVADVETGYAALGGHVPSAQETYVEDKPLRLHPTRTFLPGMKYKPEDLTLPGLGTRRPFVRPGPGFTNEEAIEQADYKNLAFLNKFVTITGRLLPRRQTKLKQKVHRHVCREVKLARQLGLLPFTGRRADFLKRRTQDSW
ncbi:unnamed protein product [Ostreobium quekettii]|uniref:Small ribosomal subunit protein bS18c n=1 Tax=Ostreobium quekettii TaxID=121088 RepID=A0A8S1IMY9_9CHLO|nr:unnamed protein product [Ostreobium quekettii]|eukprot:evm.model.scf_48.19 EVM.evm.TU.scf_48.19   scf_48:138010-139134(+)